MKEMFVNVSVEECCLFIDVLVCMWNNIDNIEV